MALYTFVDPCFRVFARDGNSDSRWGFRTPVADYGRPAPVRIEPHVETTTYRG